MKIFTSVILLSFVLNYVNAQQIFRIKLKNCGVYDLEKTEFTFNHFDAKLRTLPKNMTGSKLLEFQFKDSFIDLEVEKTLTDSTSLHKRFIVERKKAQNLELSCINGDFVPSNNFIDFEDFAKKISEFGLAEWKNLDKEYLSFRNHTNLSYDSIVGFQNKIKFAKNIWYTKQLVFIRQNPDKLASIVFLNRMVERLIYVESTDFLLTFETLNKDLKNTLLGQKLFSEIEIKSLKFKNLPEIGKKNNIELITNDLAGKRFDLNDFIGKKTLLVFWATWCGPCVYEIPFLKKIHEKYPEINLVSLSEDKSLDKLNTFIKTNKMDWTQLRIDRNVKHDFNVDAIPVSILIDEQGVFKNIHVGGLNFEDYEKFIFVK